MALTKYTVCADCLAVNILFTDCICTYSRNYKTIEVEYDVCECCGNIIDDGYPPDTEFNRKQLDHEVQTESA